MVSVADTCSLQALITLCTSISYREPAESPVSVKLLAAGALLPIIPPVIGLMLVTLYSSISPLATVTGPRSVMVDVDSDTVDIASGGSGTEIQLSNFSFVQRDNFMYFNVHFV